MAKSPGSAKNNLWLGCLCGCGIARNSYGLRRRSSWNLRVIKFFFVAPLSNPAYIPGIFRGKVDLKRSLKQMPAWISVFTRTVCSLFLQIYNLVSMVSSFYHFARSIPPKWMTTTGPLHKALAYGNRKLISKII